jgi:hypothetical protein
MAKEDMPILLNSVQEISGDEARLSAETDCAQKAEFGTHGPTNKRGAWHWFGDIPSDGDVGTCVQTKCY